MADRYWVNDAANGLWNDTGNWSAADGGAGGAGVPAGDDDVYFTGSCIDDCVIDAAVSVNSISAAAAYIGHLDNATNDQSITVAGDVTLDCTTVSMGDATWEVGGNFDNQHVTTFNRNASTLKLTGTSKTLTGHYNNYLHRLWITGTITLTSGTTTRIYVVDDVTVDGTLTIEENLDLGPTADLILNAGGVIDGADVLSFNSTAAGHGLTVLAGTLSPARVQLNQTVDGGAVWAAGAWGAAEGVRDTAGNPATVTLREATYVFKSLELESSGSGSITLANNTNGPTLIIQGDVTIDLDSTGDIIVDNSGQTVDWTIQGDVIDEWTGAGTFTWTNGTGTITASGGAAQDWNWMDQVIEDLVIDKSTGTLTFSGGLTTDVLTGQNGTLDFNGQSITVSGDLELQSGCAIASDAAAVNGASITVGGDCSFDGQTFAATASWTLVVSGTATAVDVAVAYSDASGGSTVNATSGCTDNGNNNNWSFIAGPAGVEAQQIYAPGAVAGEIFVEGAAT